MATTEHGLGESKTAMVDQKSVKLFGTPSARMMMMWVIIIFLVWALVSGQTIRFYASILFFFYSFIHIMWISVLLVGAFQTLILIPLRVVNLYKSNNINEFVKTIEEVKEEEEQKFLVKKSVRSGRQVALFYIINFFLLAVSFMSLARLYLIDFYTKPLNPDLLYSFVPYPTYPIHGRIFSIPYFWFTDTVDLGWKGVLWAWGIIMIGQLLIYVIRDLSRATKQAKSTGEVTKKTLGTVSKYTTGYTLVMLVAAFFLMRNLPVGWQIFFFRGDIAYTNPAFNAITAIVAFFTLVWLNVGKIKKKTQLAKEAGMEDKVIERTQTEMFKDTLKVSALVALGAYFVTNQIPCAFELSIFTLEIISLFSPLTLDRMILKGLKNPKFNLAVVGATEVGEPSVKAEEIDKAVEMEAEPKPPEEKPKPIEPEVKSEFNEPKEKTPVKGEIKF